jgi:hypothetical protein
MHVCVCVCVCVHELGRGRGTVQELYVNSVPGLQFGVELLSVSFQMQFSCDYLQSRGEEETRAGKKGN